MPTHESGSGKIAEQRRVIVKPTVAALITR
jgi:hypothetical protein